MTEEDLMAWVTSAGDAMLALEEAADRIEVLRAKLVTAREALELADAALSGANMNMKIVERKVRTAILELKEAQDD